MNNYSHSSFGFGLYLLHFLCLLCLLCLVALVEVDVVVIGLLGLLSLLSLLSLVGILGILSVIGILCTLGACLFGRLGLGQCCDLVLLTDTGVEFVVVGAAGLAVNTGLGRDEEVGGLSGTGDTFSSCGIGLVERANLSVGIGSLGSSNLSLEFLESLTGANEIVVSLNV